jgi:phosphoribosyl 1,2-cyclic phosphodiesterase
MNVRFWGTRGSLASPGAETARYGGNTACVEVRGSDGTILVLDAGTGIRRLGAALPRTLVRVNILLTHLHMDHIQGLGFFAPLHDPGMEIHVWGPASTTLTLAERLNRYLSPPLFPVRLRDLSCRLRLHEVPRSEVEIGEFRVTSMLVCHPGPTVGYRIESCDGVVAYLPDHEPALGARKFPIAAEWTSGYELAAGADLLIHDSQYSSEEYREHVGWGHSAFEDVVRFAELAGARHLVPFHHDPAHSDADLDRMLSRRGNVASSLEITPATEGASFDLSSRSASGGGFPKRSFGTRRNNAPDW